VLRGEELHLQAVRLHEEHAVHARQHGDEAMARLAEERAERARQRLLQTLALEPKIFPKPPVPE